jgi:hypothetical protein
VNSPPERLTISTCIGCGAMSLPGECAGGCGRERKLELVAGSELDELVNLEHEAGQRAQRLAAVLSRFLDLPDEELSNELLGAARAALHEHERDHSGALEVLATEPEPVVSWWCEQCGGVDAPAPCLGICVRRPAQWASLDALRRRGEMTAARLQTERRLAAVVRTLVLTRPRPGSESRHWQAEREMATLALSGAASQGTDTPERSVRLHTTTGRSASKPLGAPIPPAACSKGTPGTKD